MKILFFIISGLFSTQLFALSTFNREQSPFSGGMSGAADATNLNDPSGLWGNPAVLAWQKGQAVNLTMRYSAPFSKYKNLSSEVSYDDQTLEVDGHSSGTNYLAHAFYPSVYGQHKITDLFAFGWAITVPAANETKYYKAWKGRYDSIENKIFALNVEGDIAVNLYQSLGLSLGFSYQAINSEFVFSEPDSDNIDQSITNSTNLSAGSDILNEYKGSSNGFGFQAGLSYKLGLKTLVGLSFRSQIVAKNKGDFRRFQGSTVTNQNAETTSQSPSIINLGLSYIPIRNLQIFGNANYSTWSIKDSLSISTDDNSYDRQLDWKDTYMVALGFNFMSQRMVQYRGGFSYESSRQNDDYSSTAYVVGDTWSLSLGFGFEVTKIKIDFSYSYDFESKADINFDRLIANDTRNKLDGEFSVGSNNFMLGLSSQI